MGRSGPNDDYLFEHRVRLNCKFILALINGFWTISLFAMFDKLARLMREGWSLEAGDVLEKPQLQLLLDLLSLERNKSLHRPPYILRP